MRPRSTAEAVEASVQVCPLPPTSPGPEATGYMDRFPKCLITCSKLGEIKSILYCLLPTSH